jgi:predicted metal-dependent phosphoesterase TrpH
VAITDHDTVSALAIARPEAARLGVELVAGVELTCNLAGRDVHLLGHFIRDDDPCLLDAMSRLRAGRDERLGAMAAKLKCQGVVVELDAVRRTFPRAVLGRRHLAEYLVRTGQVASLKEAFTRFLGDGRAAYVAPPRLDVLAAIALIRQASGVAGLAHPPYNLRVGTLRELVDGGLRAIETGGPGISSRLSRRFRSWASELRLVPIAGSDFHGPDRPGRWVGAVTTPLPELERLRQSQP